LAHFKLGVRPKNLEANDGKFEHLWLVVWTQVINNILVGTLCVLHRCVKKHPECQNQRSIGSPFFHMLGSEIHRFPIVNFFCQNRLFMVPITTQWLDVWAPRIVQLYFQNRESLVLFCSGVSNSNLESENPRFRLFYGIPVMSPRNRCYNLLGSVTLR
jgi:hypothetical protein